MTEQFKKIRESENGSEKISMERPPVRPGFPWGKPEWGNWRIFDEGELPAHAPRNAFAGRSTKWFSFLGGPVWEWVNKDGRSLGESNSVPANIYGETTIPGTIRVPKRFRLSKYEQMILDILAEHKNTQVYHIGNGITLFDKETNEIIDDERIGILRRIEENTRYQWLSGSYSRNTKERY